MKKLFTAVIVLIALLFTYGCGSAETSIEPAIEVPLSMETPSSDAAEPSVMHMEILSNLDFGMYGEIVALPYMSALTDAYIDEHEGSSIDFAVVSRDEALELFRSGQAQAIVLAGETDGCISVAYQCIGIAVHPDNPIVDFGSSQIFDIFSGAINNWEDLGWDDAPITLYITDRNSSSRQTFEDMLSLRSSGGIAKSLITDDAVTLPDEDEVARAIVGDKYGIGIVWANSPPVNIALVAIDSVNPTESHISDGTYALSRPIVMVVTKELESLIDFTLDSKMAEISRNLGLWPIK